MVSDFTVSAALHGSRTNGSSRYAVNDWSSIDARTTHECVLLAFLASVSRSHGLMHDKEVSTMLHVRIGTAKKETTDYDIL